MMLKNVCFLFWPVINLSIYFSLDQPFLQDRGETRETVQEMQEEKEKIVLEEVVSGSDKMVRTEI